MFLDNVLVTDYILSELSPIEQTSIEALKAKLSCIYAGYIKYQEVAPKLPTINRAYYTRMAAIRNELKNFINTRSLNNNVLQVVNLGCGLDPLHLYLNTLVEKYDNTKILLINVDTAKIVELLKVAMKHLKLTNIDCTYVPLHITTNKDLDYIYTKSISEHSLTHQESALISFDIFNVQDKFGKAMEHNFSIAGSPILAPKEWNSIKFVKSLFKSFVDKIFEDKVSVITLNDYYQQIDAEERKRIEKLELIDEIEEIQLIENHAIIISINN
ncbi:uncharacterized protein LOC142598083 [Dermatophagoides farinae]|uniref:uncharacterized protein LOC142598083 n=1 Tax=Dermatophagoides farinae TaxID=6954 RepID=UPI003F5F6464